MLSIDAKAPKLDRRMDVQIDMQSIKSPMQGWGPSINNHVPRAYASTYLRTQLIF